MTYLIHNDMGLIIAMTDRIEYANAIATALGMQVERTMQAAWRLGDVLPLFHV